MNNEQFENLLKLPEGESIDFKSEFYHQNKKADMLKDVISFANGHSTNSKYIVFGVKDRENNKELIGLETFVDQSNIDQLLFENIEPHLDFELHSIVFNDKKFQVLEIKPDNKPYIMKKNYKNEIQKGTIWIRRGATNDIVTRADLDKIYNDGNVELKILDGQLYATRPDTGCADLRCKISNYSNNPVTITWGCLEIYESDTLLTSHRLFGSKGNMVGADYQLKLSPKDEVVDYFEFAFTSSQCISLGVDEYGVTNKKLTVKFFCSDANGNEYETSFSKIFIYVKGDYLSKVRQKSRYKI